MRRRRHRSTLFPYTTLFRSQLGRDRPRVDAPGGDVGKVRSRRRRIGVVGHVRVGGRLDVLVAEVGQLLDLGNEQDRKSTRLNSSHVEISYAVFCLKKKSKNA